MKNDKVDGFLDLMSDYQKSFNVLKDGGIYVTVNADFTPSSLVKEVESSGIKALAFNVWNLAQILWWVMKTKTRSNFHFVLANTTTEKLNEIEKMDLKIRIAAVFKVEEIYEAVKALKDHPQGKIVVEF